MRLKSGGRQPHYVSVPYIVQLSVMQELGLLDPKN